MQSGVYYAVLSLCFAGLYEVVSKRYSRKVRSRGMYIFGAGFVWTVLQVATFGMSGSLPFFDAVNIGFGLSAGIVLVLSNIFLIESLTHIDVGLGSTIYRLNTVGVVILAFIFLSEPLGLMKIAGVVLGIAAASLLFQEPSSAPSGSPLYFGMAIAASFFRAVYGVTSKGALMHHADPQSILLFVSLCWIAGGMLYAMLKEKRFTVTRKKIAYSLISGILIFFITNFLMYAVKYGEASVVIPIANMSFIVALVLSVALGMERLTWKKTAALTMAVAAILLLSKT